MVDMQESKYFIDFYCGKFGVKKPEFVRTSIFSSGAKTIDGLCDKLQRKIMVMGSSEFNLSDIADLNRCTILIDHYADAVPAIKKLKSKIPALTGEIHNKSEVNGYRGIHLNFYTKDGVPAEIQIATPEVSYLKQLSQAEYNVMRSMSAEEKRQNRRQLEYNSRITQQLHKLAFANGEFDRHAPHLEELLFSFGRPQKPVQIPPVLSRVFTAKDFEDFSLLRRRLSGVAEFLDASQQRFLAQIDGIVKYCRLGVSYDRYAPKKLSRLNSAITALPTPMIAEQ
jgi:hypothetical protein